MIPHFHTITADCPWPETGGGGRGAQNHYDVQDVADIWAIMMRSPLWRPESKAHRWMWATVMHLEAAHWVMHRVGFRPVTSWVWEKVGEDGELQLGMGQYQRTCHEYLLLGTRGDAMVPPPSRRPPSVFRAPRGRHSEKPEIAYTDVINVVSPGPRAELFGRLPRPGYHVWGNDVSTEDSIWPPDYIDAPEPTRGSLL